MILEGQVIALIEECSNINAAIEALGEPEDGETPTAVLQRLAGSGNNAFSSLPPDTADDAVEDALDTRRQAIFDSVAQIGRYEIREAIEFLVSAEAAGNLWDLTVMGNPRAKEAFTELCRQHSNEPMNDALQVLLNPRREGDPLAIEIATAAGLRPLPPPRPAQPQIRFS